MRLLKKTSTAGFVFLVLSVCFVWRAEAATERWVGTWASGQQLAESHNNPPSPYLANNTLRQVVHASLGGDRIRVQFSNKYSSGSITINSAHIAVSTGGSTIDTATDTALSFGGSSSVTISAGDEIYSDAVDFNVAPLSTLAVSIYFGAASSTNVTGHPGSRRDSYIKTGNAVSTNFTPDGTKTNWWILSRIDLLLDDSYACVVALGDSITDGRGSTVNGDDRYTDVLANRLHIRPYTVNVGVINQGIGGNAVVSGGLGPTALVRFDHDVLGEPGVRWLIILEGVNDIGGSSDPTVVSNNLIAAYEEFIDKAHANNILVYGVPILPFKYSVYDSPEHRAARHTVNNWIRTSGRFDAVIDMEAELRDPMDPESLIQKYNSGDNLHPNAAGHKKMARTVDPNLFVQTPDLDRDGIVNFIDFAFLAGQWRQEPNYPSGDIVPLGGDWIVDFNDFNLMTQEWLTE